MSNKLKILILTHRFYPEVGGIETNSEILATAFTEFGAEVRVLTWTQFDGKDTYPFIVVRNPGLSVIMRQHRWADVVLENNPCLRLSWLNIIIKKPLVIALNTWVNRVKGNKGLRDKLKNLWFRRAEYVIAVSDAVRKREWTDATVIENPYNDTVFTLLDTIERKKKFVFLGRLVSDKGADQAIKAIAALTAQGILDGDEPQLTVIGDGPERPELVDLREKLNLFANIDFTGMLKGRKLVECLNEHEYIIVPSCWEEPYGNVVLEGMACGCVPIASDGGGLPEAVGNAGVLFKRNNAADMEAAICVLLTEPDRRQVLCEQAKTHLALHTANAVSSRYFDLIVKAANGKKECRP